MRGTHEHETLFALKNIQHQQPYQDRKMKEISETMLQVNFSLRNRQ